ncbi:MAG: class I SAM-dependent rRNA methyltransferase [Rhodospirillaceae bacterium]
MNPPVSRHPRLYLQPRAQRRLQSGYPWVFSNEVKMDAAAKGLAPGALVTIADAGGELLATAQFNPRTLISARVLAHAPDVPVNTAFVQGKLQTALALRDRLFARPFYRLVHAEADGLPGLVIDRFGDVFVLQPNTAGMDALVPLLVEALLRLTKPRAIVLRGDTPARGLEGLNEDVRLVHGQLDGDVAVEENGATFYCDLTSGQKTGWFFDQRDNRAFMGLLSKGASALDLFAHTGGFAIAMARGGAAPVTAVDRSAHSLELAGKAAHANGVACAFEKADVFSFLENAARRKRTWQVVVADPPAFVKSKKDLKAGLQGYRKLARLCAEVTARGGYLLIASCSHNAPLDEFTAAVARGLGDVNRSGKIIRTAGAGPDHPVHPLLPESAYLKALVFHLD